MSAGRRPWLEVDVGTGRSSAALHVDCGVDPAAAMLTCARRREICVVRRIGEALPFPDRSFEVVLL